jgi:hypothetical protein
MLNDTKQWKQLIKAKIAEKSLEPDILECQKELSAKFKVRSRDTFSALKYATLNSTLSNAFSPSPNSLQTMASSKKPVSVRKFSAHLVTDSSPTRKPNLFSSPAKIRSKTPLVKAELLK